MIIETFTITSQEVAKKDLANQKIDELFLLQTKIGIDKKLPLTKEQNVPNISVRSNCSRRSAPDCKFDSAHQKIT